MARRRDEESEEYEEELEQVMDDEGEVQGRQRLKRRRSVFADHVVDEEEDDDEDYGGRRQKTYRRAAQYFDIEAEVDSDEEEEDEEEGEDDFIVASGADLLGEDDGGRIHRLPLLPQDEEEEDVEALERRIQAKYARSSHAEYDEEITEVEQQALLPSVKDPSLWLVKCATGCEREIAACLMQKCIDKRSELQIISAIALDHLKNYIYIEAYREAHVREACKGLCKISAKDIKRVEITEMTDVLSVKSKAIDLSGGTWVRMKRGTYKGDLAKVVDVDNVRQKVKVKLIPRIDLQALANKLEGKEVPKKSFVPPPRFMNVAEARNLHIPVKHKRDKVNGDYFEIGGMKFEGGFLCKEEVSMTSISTQNIMPTFDEIENFRKLGGRGDGDIVSLSTLSANRRKAYFIRGDPVIVVKGDLKDLKGWVEKVEEEIVHIKPAITKPEMEHLPKTLSVNEKELRKYFEPGKRVKVVSGTKEGTTGMVVKVEQNLLIILSETTKEHIRVLADDVVDCSEVTGETKIDDSYSRFGSFRIPHIPPTPSRLSKGENPYNSGVRHRRGRGQRDGLVGMTVKIRLGPYKGCRGRVVDVRGPSVRVELESQMNLVTVDRRVISDNVVSTAYCDTFQCGRGGETPLHPCMTPMRDPGATPIHDGMRTPMRNPAWNPYLRLSPPSPA
ncbi:hypothetical protein SLEP1_g34084 [Rubroshorea leprosula]|uniref:Transcription elongation factor SPT5 n=1 Tax=Rubroshorea leprosula TaxID=152421 RepID=A0AAV5KIP8_9ROSI|nr:hypothetical protein SLEP1_g34084 [Rubroshorea leprosula]